MKTTIYILLAVSLVAVSCVPKKPEPKQTDSSDMSGGTANPHGQTSDNPHGQMSDNPHAQPDESGPGLDVDGLVAKLPSGWTKQEPSSSMRIAQIGIPLAPGDKGTAEIALFHFPGSGGSAGANIQRWQGQMKGPNGEPGSAVAKTDTVQMSNYSIITTDVTGIMLASSMGSGPTTDTPNSRLIASVVVTPGGNWFVKATGPQKTITAQESNFRAWVKSAKLKG